MELCSVPLSEWPEEEFLGLHWMICESRMPEGLPRHPEVFFSILREYERRNRKREHENEARAR